MRMPMPRSASASASIWLWSETAAETSPMPEVVGRHYLRSRRVPAPSRVPNPGCGRAVARVAADRRSRRDRSGSRARSRGRSRSSDGSPTRYRACRGTTPVPARRGRVPRVVRSGAARPARPAPARTRPAVHPARRAGARDRPCARALSTRMSISSGSKPSASPMTIASKKSDSGSGFRETPGPPAMSSGDLPFGTVGGQRRHARLAEHRHDVEVVHLERDGERPDSELADGRL